MKYDFTSILDRHNHDAIAVDGPTMMTFQGMPHPPKEGWDFIPMWVADMNFPVAPSITEALRKRIEHPAYGYFMPEDAYFDEIIRWQNVRNGVEGLTRDAIGYENGVLGGVASALKALTAPGDAILVHSPTYIGFTHTLEDNGYEIVLSPLVQDENGVYRMDFSDMEKKIKDHHIRAAVFCSPHNPTGRVWSREEIEGAMAVYEKYGVTVIADEIWSDLILSGNHHVPTQSVSEYARNNTVALYAPSKTFNLAGLVGSYHIIYDPALNRKVMKVSGATHYNDMNVLSMHALIGAYEEAGMEWVDELCEVLTENVRYATDFIDQNFEGVSCTHPEGTYMLFVDCTKWCEDHQMTLDELMSRGSDYGVGWQDGRPFHGPCHIRMNLALPTARVKEASRRLREYVFI